MYTTRKITFIEKNKNNLIVHRKKEKKDISYNVTIIKSLDNNKIYKLEPIETKNKNGKKILFETSDKNIINKNNNKFLYEKKYYNYPKKNLRVITIDMRNNSLNQSIIQPFKSFTKKFN